MSQSGAIVRRKHVEPGTWAVLAIGLAVVVALEAYWLVTAVIGPDPAWSVGMDFAYYRELGVRWLADGSFYLPRQLEGPYVVGLLEQAAVVDTQYPPSALLLFVPFAVLPAILWWVLPVGVTAFALRTLRPARWSWPVMLLLLAWPRAVGAYLFGNTDIWMVAAVAAGLLWGWPALALTMKPTFLPLALIGVRRRSWWIAAAMGVAFVAVSWPLWRDFLIAMGNARGRDLGYSLGSLPLIVIPLVAWLARRTGSDDQVTIR